MLKYQPLFIKPNKDELEEMFDMTVESDQDVVKYGREILKEGAQSVIISLGGDGAIYIDKTRSIKAQNPKGQVVNTVGSGDSTVAGMVAGLESDYHLKMHFNKLFLGQTAFTEDLATIEDIEKLNHRLLLQYLMGSEINENHRITNKRYIAMDLSRLIKMVSLMN